MLTKAHKKIIATASLGSALECYDFIIFVFMAKKLGELFFPTHDPIASLMQSFAVFAVGYAARFLGGIFFGHWGDKLGRKRTFIFTIFLMALPTFCIGLLPTYAQVGILAPLLLILLRICQGFSMGGELPGVLVFVTESVIDKKRGFANGIILAGVNLGLLLGSLVAAGVLHLPQHLFGLWGWRVPFYFGGVLGVISFYLRRSIQETPLFKSLEKHSQIVNFPLLKILSHHKKELLQGMIIAAMGATAMITIFLFMPNYLSVVFHLPLNLVMLLNTINIFIFVVFILVFSYLSDRYGRKLMLVIGATFMLLFAYPVFLIFENASFFELILATNLLSIFVGFMAGSYPCLISELFPTSIRYTGMAFSYNFGFGIVGGFMPLLLMYLIHKTQNNFAPSFVLIGLSLLGILALCFVQEPSRKPLKH